MWTIRFYKYLCIQKHQFYHNLTLHANTVINMEYVTAMATSNDKLNAANRSQQFIFLLELTDAVSSVYTISSNVTTKVTFYVFVLCISFYVFVNTRVFSTLSNVLPRTFSIILFGYAMLHWYSTIKLALIVIQFSFWITFSIIKFTSEFK